MAQDELDQPRMDQLHRRVEVQLSLVIHQPHQLARGKPGPVGGQRLVPPTVNLTGTWMAARASGSPGPMNTRAKTRPS